MAEQSLSIKDLIENLDVAGGGAYKGENTAIMKYERNKNAE